MGLFAFLILIQLLITLVHWIIFQSVSHYFQLEGIVEYYVFWGFLLSSFSFLLSNIATRLFPGHLSRFAYRMGALWLGTVHFLFLGATVIALLEIISWFLHFPMPALAAWGVYIGALGFSVYAWKKGREIQVVHKTVSLPYLPTVWQGKKLFFFADTHFGNIHRERLARQITDILEREKPDIILMGGDFFDGPPIEADLVTAPFYPVAGHIPTYFVSGNHEEYGKKADFLRSLEAHGFRIINDKKVVIDGLQIVGLDFMTTRTEAATAMTLKHLEINPFLPTIVLKHIPRHIEIIESLGGHLMLCGHTHQGQMWPFSLVTEFIYRGFDYGLKYFKNLVVYTTSGAGSWGPPQRLGTKTEVVIFTLVAK
jgi:predicted MPP superfamily phosphohydrolase